MKRNLVRIFLILVLVSIFSVSAYAADSVDVTIVDYDVTVNGSKILTEKSDYPVLSYKNITYFPLTFDYLSGLGLKLDFSEADGLKVNSSGSVGELSQIFLSSENVLGSVHKANVASFGLEVNGKVINNFEEEYPVLLYKDITYFPMTWRFATTEFKWTTSWSNETGFGISASGSDAKPVVIEKPVENTNETDTALDAIEIGKLASSVVKLIVETHDGEQWTGSGFYFAEGEIITNYHVIAHAKSIKVIDNDDTEYDGDVIVTAYSRENDLATLYIDKKANTTIELGFGYIPSVGERVYTIGSPLGIKNTLADGIISTIIESKVIQISAPISSGSSGGVLLNENGQAIGITTAIAVNGENISFAIDVNLLNDLVKVFDVASQEYVSPYSGEAVPVERISVKPAGAGVLYIGWEDSGADYYKVYISNDDEEFKEIENVTTGANMWYYDTEYSAQISNVPGAKSKIRITAVKDGIESGSDFDAYIEFPSLDIEDYEETLLEAASSFTISGNRVEIAYYDIQYREENDTYYVLANISSDSFDRAKKLTIYEKETLLEKLSNFTAVVQNNLGKYTLFTLAFEGGSDVHIESLDVNSLTDESNVLQEDGTYSIFFPLLILDGYYSQGDLYYEMWND